MCLLCETSTLQVSKVHSYFGRYSFDHINKLYEKVVFEIGVILQYTNHLLENEGLKRNTLFFSWPGIQIVGLIRLPTGSVTKTTQTESHNCHGSYEIYSPRWIFSDTKLGNSMIVYGVGMESRVTFYSPLFYGCKVKKRTLPLISWPSI